MARFGAMSVLRNSVIATRTELLQRAARRLVAGRSPGDHRGSTSGRRRAARHLRRQYARVHRVSAGSGGNSGRGGGSRLRTVQACCMSKMCPCPPCRPGGGTAPVRAGSCRNPARRHHRSHQRAAPFRTSQADGRLRGARGVPAAGGRSRPRRGWLACQRPPSPYSPHHVFSKGGWSSTADGQRGIRRLPEPHRNAAAAVAAISPAASTALSRNSQP
eukprot:364726-Chlamydomonas_euryale.AAC.6